MDPRHPRHPWQVIAASMPQVDATVLLGDFKKHRIEKSELWQCHVCMAPAPHAMRVQRMRCTCQACKDVAVATVCPWRARVMTCQLESLVTIEVAYNHLTPARAPRRPVLTPPMKEVVREWAAQGLKPKRIWNALLQRFSLTEATAPMLSSVQRFAHHHVTGRLGGSDDLDAVRKKIRDAAFTGGEEETAAFTFTSRSDRNGNASTGNGSDRDPFVVGVSSKKLLRRADRDPESFIFHMDATYKLTQVGYPVVVVGISDRARRFHLLAIFIVSQQQQQHHAEVLELLRCVFEAVTEKPLRVRYVMGDADAAQWNAVHEVLARDNDLMFLMCYFHVAKKIYEKTRGMLPDTAASVMTDLHELHFSTCEESFHQKLAEVQESWAKNPGLARFSAYFSKTWLDDRFKRWQCFHTPGGYATTNNPCETFNAAIKRDVTLRRKLKVGALLPQIMTLCTSEGMLPRPFEVQVTPDARLVRRVKAMARAGLLSLHSATRGSISFILCDAEEESSSDIVRVVGRPSPRIYDDLRKRTVEDLPVSAQLNKLTARMETLGMPSDGWEVDMETLTCPCQYWGKFACCIHSLYASQTRGAVDILGRATLVNRGVGRARSGRAGRPRTNGPALATE